MASASDNPIFIPGMLAGADLSSYQYYMVEIDSTENQVTVCNAATDIAIGSVYSKPTTEGNGVEIAAFAPGHFTKVKVASGGVTAGWVGTDSSGLLENKSTAGDFCVGLVLGSYDSGDIAPVLGLPCRLHA